MPALLISRVDALGLSRPTGEGVTGIPFSMALQVPSGLSITGLMDMSA